MQYDVTLADMVVKDHRNHLAKSTKVICIICANLVPYVFPQIIQSLVSFFSFTTFCLILYQAIYANVSVELHQIV